MTINRRKFLKTGLLSAIGAIFIDALWLEKFFIEIKEFYIGSASKESSNLKVIQISDLHIKSLNFQLRSLSEEINKLNPDLLLITGDAIDDSTNLSLLGKFLQLIKYDIKKVAVLGNWEYWGNVDIDELTHLYNKNNCSLLINESIQLSFKDKTISVTGIDDYIGGNSDIATALLSYKPSDFHLILNHCPQYADTISEYITDGNDSGAIIFSGHTHGGQINLFGWIPFLPPGSGNYVKGWYETGKSKMYVSKGIGTSLIPVRFFARAEAIVFYF
ncbi:MAG: metallophosphoesterase [Sporocytophaga sp.]|nr:metallophosphoesterase [Sporocytophaga sp.]